MIQKRLRSSARSSVLDPRATCWPGALLLATACTGRGGTQDRPVAGPTPAMASPDNAVQVPRASSDPTPAGVEPTGIAWAVPAGEGSAALSLKVGLDAGGGQVRVNATGEILVAAPMSFGSGEDEQVLPALARRDAAGAGLWARAYSPDARLFASLEDDGTTLSAGEFTGSLPLSGAELESFRNPSSTFGSASNRDQTYGRGQSSRDIAVFRLTPEGDVVWARRFGDAGDQGAKAIEPAGAGQFVVVGDFVGQLVMDELSVTCSGGGSQPDVFVARFDLAGNALSLWRESPLYVDAIAVEPDGVLWIAGRERTPGGPGDNRLWKLGPDGQRQLSIDVSSGGSASAMKLAPGPDGSLYVLYNQTKDEPLFGRGIAGDGALVRLSAEGEVDWLQPLRADFTRAIFAADRAGNVAVAGAYRASIDLGAGPLASSGELDIFVAGFSAQGSLRYSLRLGSSGLDGVNDVAAMPSGGWLIPFYIEQPVLLGEQPLSAGNHLLWLDEL